MLPELFQHFQLEKAGKVGRKKEMSYVTVADGSDSRFGASSI